MYKWKILFFAIGLSVITTQAQTTKKKIEKSNNDKFVGDSTIDDAKNSAADNIPIISLDENDNGDGSTQNVSSALTAGRDPFFNGASRNFSAVRFRIRGYDQDLFSTYMNGVPMENLDNGFTPFGLWGGLNDVTRNQDLSIGLRPNNYAFGDIGSNTHIDTRASKQRKQTEFGYAIANRTYVHRFDLTHSTGISKKGWAFSFSGSRRYALEGYTEGSYYDGWSYFIAVDKIYKKHLFSFVGFGASTENGKQGPATKESYKLAGSNFYNPYWGYQQGKKRNSRVGKIHEPILIFTHDYRINNKSNIVSAVSYSFGTRGAGQPDWFNAADPRPDYYRYLPSYFDDKPDQFAAVSEAWKNNPSLGQINWTNIYEANYANKQTFNGVTGKRALYVLYDATTKTNHINLNSVYNAAVGEHINFTGGVSYQSQQNEYYKKLTDLLGADYHADLNQFAERSFPNDLNANQNDLNNPNRAVKVGEKYGYDYVIDIEKSSAWAQGVFKYNSIDAFAAVEISSTSFFRDGKYKNGLFPTNSYGASTKYTFNNYAVKGGITYKINGRNYIYANMSSLTKAPFFDNVYVSPRTRNSVQPDIKNEEITSIEGGYVLNAPKLKVRVGGYYTEFKNAMNVLPYYDDSYQNFVNIALRGINKVHFGGEFGVEAKVLPNITVQAVAAVGRYYYTSGQQAQTTVDNDNKVVANDSVYLKNYNVGGTPQQAYSFNISYRSPKFWFVSLTANYFDEMYVEASPIRRTARAIGDSKVGSQNWADILNQEKISGQYTLDLFTGYSYKLPKRMSINHKNTFLVFNLGISNLLNNKEIVSGGFEQLRFDFVEHNPNKFPSKYFYSFGVNYYGSITLRF